MAVFVVSRVDDSGKTADVQKGDETPWEGVLGESLQLFWAAQGVAAGMNVVGKF